MYGASGAAQGQAPLPRLNKKLNKSPTRMQFEPAPVYRTHYYAAIGSCDSNSSGLV